MSKCVCGHTAEFHKHLGCFGDPDCPCANYRDAEAEQLRARVAKLEAVLREIAGGVYYGQTVAMRIAEEALK